MKSILLVKKLLGLVEMTSGLVNASFSLPERQAVKMIFFAPCEGTQHLWKILNTVEPSVSNHPKCKDSVVAYVRSLLTRMDGQVVSSKNGS